MVALTETIEERDLASDALHIAGEIRRLAARTQRRVDRVLAGDVRRIAIRMEEVADYLEEVAR